MIILVLKYCRSAGEKKSIGYFPPPGEGSGYHLLRLFE